MSAVHFSINNGTALACGRNKGEVTVLPKRVTCQKCKATRAFKDAAQEINEGFTSGPHKATPEQVETLREGLRQKEAFDADRVSPPLVRVSWDTISDFLKRETIATGIIVAEAINYGDSLGLETWIDVRNCTEFYWKAGTDA